MSPRPRTTSRDVLVDAALRCFSAAGVAGTSIDDIVREAGVAKGTFYLYFASRDEIVTAVAERLVDGIGSAMEQALRDEARPAVDRLRGVAIAMLAATEDPAASELVGVIHRPENRSIHDRLGGAIMARLLPAVIDVIVAGIADGSLREQDPRRAAAFFLGALSAVDSLVTAPDELEPTITDVQAFVLRGLGASGVDR